MVMNLIINVDILLMILQVNRFTMIPMMLHVLWWGCNEVNDTTDESGKLLLLSDNDIGILRVDGVRK